MTDTARKLIQRLTEKLDLLHCQYNVPNQSALIDEAHAYLDQPELEGLTDEELLGCMLKAAASVPGGRCAGILGWHKEAIAAARAVIAADRARWRRPVTPTETP
jgi:hypothetical protein